MGSAQSGCRQTLRLCLSVVWPVQSGAHPVWLVSTDSSFTQQITYPIAHPTPRSTPVTNEQAESSLPRGKAAASLGAQDQPLGLTVHAMPMLDRSGTLAPNTAAGRWKMLAVLLICAAPVIASYFTYYVIRPEGRRNFGELIDPHRPPHSAATIGPSIPSARRPGRPALV